MKLRLIMKMQRRQSRRGGEDLIHRQIVKEEFKRGDDGDSGAIDGVGTCCRADVEAEKKMKSFR